MEFSTESWANHQRGRNKRAEILAYLSKRPDASPQEIAEFVGLSIYQTRRHLSTIHLERGLKSMAVASAFAICSIPVIFPWCNSLGQMDNSRAIAFLENKDRS
jgi:DNA-binding CsgD family transcriptional regulator